MATGWTNRGKIRILEMALRGEYAGGALPSNLYIMVFTDDNVPDCDTNLVSDLTEITAGNGYATGGYALNLNSTDFDTLTEDDTNNLGKILIKLFSWTASGGSIPDSGKGGRYVGLTNDNATIADREVLFYWDLAEDRSVADGGDFTLDDLQIDALETG